MGEFTREQIADFLREDVAQWITVKDVSIENGVSIEEHGVFFELVSEVDPWPEDYQMKILTTMFSGSDLDFWIPRTNLRWTFA